MACRGKRSINETLTAVNDPPRKKTRGRGKKSLTTTGNEFNAIPTGSIFKQFLQDPNLVDKTTAFEEFVKTVTEPVNAQEETTEERDKRLQRAPIAKFAKPRSVPIVVNENKRTGWRVNRFQNKTKHSLHEFIQFESGCHTKLHQQKKHVCKKGLTYAECGVEVKDGRLWCCGKPRKVERSALTNHVNTTTHDKWQEKQKRQPVKTAHAIRRKRLLKHQNTLSYYTIPIFLRSMKTICTPRNGRKGNSQVRNFSIGKPRSLSNHSRFRNGGMRA